MRLHLRLLLATATALHCPLRPVMVTALHFLLRRESVILRLAVAPAMAKRHCPAAFLRRAREMGSHQVVVAASFAVRFSPALDPSAAVRSAVCRSQIRFATVGFVPAAGSFDLAVVVDLSVVAADPGSAGSVVVGFVDPFFVAAFS